MTITVAEGEAFAARWLKACADGFHNNNNNHRETMKGLLADNVSWSSSDGTKGEGSPGDLFDILSATWGSLVSEWMYGKPFICVDTGANEIIMMMLLTVNVSGGLPNETNLFQIPEAQRIVLNDDMKVTHWRAVWDNNNPECLEAVERVLSRLGKEAPPPSVTRHFTVSEGEAWANESLQAFSAGFAKNNHSETMRKFYSSGKISWEWSDGTKGEGTFDDHMALMAKTWGSLIDSWLYAAPHIVVDPEHAIVIIGVSHVANITAGFSDENNPVHNDLVLVYHLDNDMKCYKVVASWDNNNPLLLAAIAKVSTKIEAENKAAQGVGMHATHQQVKLTGQ